MPNPVTVQQGFPQMETPMTDANGRVTRPWYRFLISMWQKTGQGTSQGSTAAYLQLSPGPTGLPVQVINATTGTVIGTVAFGSSSGGPAQPQAIAGSPFIFTAGANGTLVIFGAEAELSRDHGVTYYPATLNGGALPMLLGDVIRVTWFNPASPPQITFLPSV